MLLQLGPATCGRLPVTADLGLAESNQDRLDVRFGAICLLLQQGRGIVIVCMQQPVDLHRAASSRSASTHSYYRNEMRIPKARADVRLSQWGLEAVLDAGVAIR